MFHVDVDKMVPCSCGKTPTVSNGMCRRCCERSAPKKKEPATCECGEPAVVRGMCRRCYRRDYYRRTSKVPKRKPPAVCACGKPAHAQGLCKPCRTRDFHSGILKVVPTTQIASPEEVIQLAESVGLRGWGWRARLAHMLGVCGARISQALVDGIARKTLEKWREKLEVSPGVLPPIAAKNRLTLILGKHFTRTRVLHGDKWSGVTHFPEAGLHPSKVQIPTTGRCYTHAEFVIQEVGLQIASGKRDMRQAVVEIHNEDGRITVCNYDKDGVLNNWPADYFSRSEK